MCHATVGLSRINNKNLFVFQFKPSDAKLHLSLPAPDICIAPSPRQIREGRKGVGPRVLEAAQKLMERRPLRGDELVRDDSRGLDRHHSEGQVEQNLLDSAMSHEVMPGDRYRELDWHQTPQRT